MATVTTSMRPLGKLVRCNLKGSNIFCDRCTTTFRRCTSAETIGSKRNYSKKVTPPSEEEKKIKQEKADYKKIAQALCEGKATCAKIKQRESSEFKEPLQKKHVCKIKFEELSKDRVSGAQSCALSMKKDSCPAPPSGPLCAPKPPRCPSPPPATCPPAPPPPSRPKTACPPKPASCPPKPPCCQACPPPKPPACPPPKPPACPPPKPPDCPPPKPACPPKPPDCPPKPPTCPPNPCDVVKKKTKSTCEYEIPDHASHGSQSASSRSNLRSADIVAQHNQEAIAIHNVRFRVWKSTRRSVRERQQTFKKAFECNVPIAYTRPSSPPTPTPSTILHRVVFPRRKESFKTTKPAKTYSRKPSIFPNRAKEVPSGANKYGIPITHVYLTSTTEPPQTNISSTKLRANVAIASQQQQSQTSKTPSCISTPSCPISECPQIPEGAGKNHIYSTQTLKPPENNNTLNIKHAVPTSSKQTKVEALPTLKTFTWLLPPRKDQQKTEFTSRNVFPATSTNSSSLPPTAHLIAAQCQQSNLPPTVDSSSSPPKIPAWLKFHPTAIKGQENAITSKHVIPDISTNSSSLPSTAHLIAAQCQQSNLPPTEQSSSSPPKNPAWLKVHPAAIKGQENEKLESMTAYEVPVYQIYPSLPPFSPPEAQHTLAPERPQTISPYTLAHAALIASQCNQSGSSSIGNSAINAPEWKPSQKVQRGDRKNETTTYEVPACKSYPVLPQTNKPCNEVNAAVLAARQLTATEVTPCLPSSHNSIVENQNNVNQKSITPCEVPAHQTYPKLPPAELPKMSNPVNVVQDAGLILSPDKKSENGQSPKSPSIPFKLLKRRDPCDRLKKGYPNIPKKEYSTRANPERFYSTISNPHFCQLFRCLNNQESCKPDYNILCEKLLPQIKTISAIKCLRNMIIDCHCSQINKQKSLSKPPIIDISAFAMQSINIKTLAAPASDPANNNNGLESCDHNRLKCINISEEKKSFP